MQKPASQNQGESTQKALLFGGLQAASTLLDLLLPPACRLCDEPVNPSQDFCHSCWLALTLSDPAMRSACPRCGRPGGIASTDSHATSQQTRQSVAEDDPVSPCVHCKKEKFHFNQVIAKWTYQGKVCDAIVAAKYARQSALGNALGRQLGKRAAEALHHDPPDQVTYVPSSFRRQWARGGRSGNLAIAEAVMEGLQNGCRLAPNQDRADADITEKKIALKSLLRTTRRIKKQAWLSDTERRQNVSGAFATKKGYAWPKDFRILGKWPTQAAGITNQHILVVDDVLTTGATANEVAKVLREAGARRVTLAVVARAVWAK